MPSKPKAAPRKASAVKEERRARPRADRIALTPEDRALPGYALTFDAWPAEMMRPLGNAERYDNNPRQNEEAVQDVMSSLRSYAANQPIVVDGDGVIVVGDTRHRAAERLGWPRFPIHVADYLTPAQARAYRIADNKTGERAEWDFPKLKIELEALRGDGFDLTGTGWRDFELSPILMSDWTPPAKESLGGGDGEGGEDRERGEKPVANFDGEQWPRVLPAIERMRERSRQPNMSFAEALTRICLVYLNEDE